MTAQREAAYLAVVKALKIAHEWAASFPLSGWQVSWDDTVAANTVYLVADKALAEAAEAEKDDD